MTEEGQDEDPEWNPVDEADDNESDPAPKNLTK